MFIFRMVFLDIFGRNLVFTAFRWPLLASVGLFGSCGSHHNSILESNKLPLRRNLPDPFFGRAFEKTKPTDWGWKWTDQLTFHRFSNNEYWHGNVLGVVPAWITSWFLWHSRNHHLAPAIALEDDHFQGLDEATRDSGRIRSPDHVNFPSQRRIILINREGRWHNRTCTRRMPLSIDGYLLVTGNSGIP